MRRRILGIDPGSVHLGIACVEREGNHVHLIHAEVMDAPKRAPLFERLEIISAKLKGLVDHLSPHEVAVEDIFYSKDVRSAFHLGMARGVAIAACLGRGITIFEYAPAKVKSIVAGSGRADKEQVKKMVQLQLGRRLDQLKHDATDAIAIALCHLHASKLISGAG